MISPLSQYLPVEIAPNAKGRTDKVPVNTTGRPCDAHNRAHWMPYDAALAAARALQTAPHAAHVRYGVGFVLTAADDVFCIDIDHALQDGQWSALAQELVNALPGCYVEVSQSGQGLHIWGRYANPPPHRMKRIDLGIECYTERRFILLGTNGVGAVAEQCPGLPAVVERYFKPAPTLGAGAVPDDGPRSDWRGPASDEDLLRRAMKSASTRAKLGDTSRAIFRDLWTANADALARAFPPDPSSTEPFDRSSADAALAAHLAYWTGCDVARIERLMRRSALAREKWDARADYLVARTIFNACQRQRDVLQDKPPVAPPGMSQTVLALPTEANTVATADTTEVTAIDPVFGEDALALIFAQHHAHAIRWTPSIGWVVRRASVFERDRELVRYDIARQICRAAATGCSKESERRYLQSAKAVNGVLTLAQADPRLLVPDNAWNADPLVFNTPGGAFDLRNGAPVDPSGHWFTHCAAVTPDFNASAPIFNRFITDVFDNDQELIAFVQRALGYSLTGDRREQVILFFHGVGANGKSTLIDLMSWLMGTYALKLPASTLMTNRHHAEHLTSRAQLQGKRLAVSSELDDGQFFDEPLLKELTGDEQITARFMRGDFFTFTQTQKHVIVGNYRPRLRGGDPAIARRMLLVPFDAVFSAGRRDPAMPDKLRSEAPAIMAWLIRGAMQWHTQGLAAPERVRLASGDYMADHDDLAQWLDECSDREGETGASALFGNFSAWKARRGEHAPSQTAWAERLARLPEITKRRSNGMRYAPIRLKTPTFVATV